MKPSCVCVVCRCMESHFQGTDGDNSLGVPLESWVRGKPGMLSSVRHSDHSPALCQNCPVAGVGTSPATGAVLGYISSPRTPDPQAGQPWAGTHSAPSFRSLQLVLVPWAEHSAPQDAVPILRSFCCATDRAGTNKECALLTSKTRLKQR